jgi:acetoin utilization protein AcuC
VAGTEAMVTIVYDEAYGRYSFGESHPFSPTRQEMALDLLRALGHGVNPVSPPEATREDILTVHDRSLVDAVQKASAGAARTDYFRFGLDTPDVPLFPDMDESARILCGGTLHAAHLISSDHASVVLQFGGGLHHARFAESSGFCVYNDLSIAITHFRRRGLRVAYIDIDVHHGDGVQALHYEDPDVLTISLHESGRYLYPGTGFVRELGEKDGRGYSLNVPLEPGTTDSSFIECFDLVVPHALSWFQPDVIVAQCGADAHYRDPLADLALTTHAFETVLRRIVDLADRHAGGRLLATLGGGYDADPTARIWAMLTMLLSGRDLPRELPSEYVNGWSERLGRKLTSTLHDPHGEIEHQGRASAERQNRLNAKRLMELAPPMWF